MPEISWLAANQLFSQEGLCTVEWVSKLKSSQSTADCALCVSYDTQFGNLWLKEETEFTTNLRVSLNLDYRSQWPSGLRRISAGRSPAEIVGSNPTGDMDICLLWVLCVVRLRSLRRADHSSRGVLLTVMRYFVCDLETSWMRRSWPTGKAVVPKTNWT